MADENLPLSSTAAPEAGFEVPGGDEAAAKRVRRLRNRFLYAWTHPKWIKWRRESKEDFAFHSGTGHWPADIRKKLEDADRAVLTINEVRPVVEVLVGYERGSRLEVRPVPEGKEDLEDVTVLARLMKRVGQDQELDFLLSDGFKDGVIGGVAGWFVGVDYTDDPIHGRVVVVPLDARKHEVLWDPDAKRYNLSDAREVFWHKMVPVDVLKAHYPEQEEAIERAASTLSAAQGKGELGYQEIPAHDAQDAYKDGRAEAPISFYNKELGEIRVLEAWYRTWETVHLLADRERNRVEEIPDDKDAMEVARKLAEIDPDNVRIIRRLRRRIEMSVILPATGIELEHGNPFENDLEEYPIIPFIAYVEGDELLGIVRNLKDSQREVNKRRSALVDNVSRFGNIRWLSTRGALENPEFLQEGQGAGTTGWLRSPNIKPEQLTPPPMPEWVWRMDQVSKNEIREISGVNPDLLGFSDKDSSGIAIARRQQQGQIISTGLFDNYRRSRRILGKRLAKRIQQVYTGEMTVRVVNDAGQTEFVQINQRKIDDMGKETVVRDIPSLKYDVEIADSPSTPTSRASALLMMLELIERVPAFAMGLADVIIELSDVPNREQILRRVRAIMQKAGVPLEPEIAPRGVQPPLMGGPAAGAQEVAGGPLAGGLA